MGKSKGTTEAQANKAIRDVEDLLPVRKKRLDISNALSYIERVIAKITKRKKTNMNDNKAKKSTKKNIKVNVKHLIASTIAAPFIVQGVASMFTSNVAYAEYVIGGLVAGFFLYVILEK